MATCLRFQPNFVRSCMNLVNNRCFSSLSLYSGSPDHNGTSNSARPHFQQANTLNFSSSKRLLHSWINTQSCNKLNSNMFCFSQNSKVNYSQSSNANPLKKSNISSDKDEQKTQAIDHCSRVQKILVNEIKEILYRMHNYSIYTHDIIFENNWNPKKPYTTSGIGAYVLKIAKVRFATHFKYAKVEMTVQSSSIDQKTNSISIHWKLTVLRQGLILMFWMFRPSRFNKTAAEESDVMEGISTFYLNDKGYIYKHKLDRVTPVQQQK